MLNNLMAMMISYTDVRFQKEMILLGVGVILFFIGLFIFSVNRRKSERKAYEEALKNNKDVIEIDVVTGSTWMMGLMLTSAGVILALMALIDLFCASKGYLFSFF